MSITHRVSVVFSKALSGSVQIAHGRLVSGGRFVGEERIAVEVAEARVGVGAKATRVTVRPDDGQGFTFFLRDVSRSSPILIPSLGAAVVPEADTRTYGQIEADVRSLGLASQQQRLESGPEPTFAGACEKTRDQRCPIWLGVGRDVRIFRIMPQTDGSTGQMGYWGRVEPWNHSLGRDIPENLEPIRYGFVLGRGAMCEVDIEQRLDDGCLPILQSVQRDGEVEYRLTAFATLEKSPLGDGRVRGTHPTAALANTLGAMLTRQELTTYDNELRSPEIRKREEELVCWVHVEAVNAGRVPRYAYFQAAGETPNRSTYDPATGRSIRDAKLTQASGDAGDVVSLSRLDGRPMPQREVAVLLQPGAPIAVDFLFPHRPLTPNCADALAGQDYTTHLEACRAYWRAKLASAASIRVPEAAIDERIRAGLLHLDLNTLGLTDSGRLLATVGWYSPIGSESSPMIQFFDSVGWHDIAERSIQFFLDRQREDGFIQTFGGYQLETGPALWTIGEHFRYTRDAEWARRIRPNVLAACRYVLEWRKRNLREELRGRGYGLLDGKVADPEDFFHSFMLNGLAYVGLKRIAEMYRGIDPALAESIGEELPGFLADIRTAYAENVAASPVIPLSDGTWTPSFGPWAEYPGPVSLFAEGGDWFSHGTFVCRDALIGALYLGISEVLDPRECLAGWLVAAHQELMTHRNAGVSQPYYCRHDWLHLKRGEVREYLQTFYTQLASLQDRRTYTFWEHYYGVSQHKTHEEGWFLMQARWMLWDEDHDTGTLRLLPMIPQAWMEPGKEIRLQDCVSTLGRFGLHVRSNLGDGRIEAEVSLDNVRPELNRLVIRLPHPHGLSPVGIEGATYETQTQSVVIEQPGPTVRVALTFARN